MDSLILLEDENYHDELVNRIKKRITKFNNDLFESSVITVVSNIEKRKIYSLFIDYYIFDLSDVSFFKLATNKDFKDEVVMELNAFVKRNLKNNNELETLELSNDYIQSIINIICFQSFIKKQEIDYKNEYYNYLYAHILKNEKIIQMDSSKRKLSVDKYKFIEINNIVENHFKNDTVYIEIIKLTNFIKITPSEEEVYEFINFIIKKGNFNKLYLELPAFENDDELYPFLKIIYPEDAVFVAENIPIFLNIGRALSKLNDIEVNVVVPRVDTERELDFIKRLITNNHEHEMFFHILHPYDVSFKSIIELKKYKTLILDFSSNEIENVDELLDVIDEYKDSIKDVKNALLYRREVCIKTNYLDDEKVINFFINRGYRTMFFDKNSNQETMISEIKKIAKRRKTLKLEF